MKSFQAPFNLGDWVEEHSEELKPPIGNIQLFKGQWENLLSMIVGGPNFRPDYHDDPGEELFIQIKGDLTLKLLDPVTRERTTQIVREGEIFLLPSHVRHSPQRPEGCIGLVVERLRQPGEVDALEWYDDEGRLEFRGEFYIKNIEKDLATVQAAWARWKENENRTIPTVWRVGEPLD